MTWLILARNAAFYVAAGLMTLVMSPMLPLAYSGIISWELTARSYLGGIAFLLRHVCGISVQVTGSENIPDGPVLFAGAQQSTWENLYFPHLFGNPVFFMMNEMVGYPIVRNVVLERGYIAANRGKGADAIRETFAQARSRKGDGRSYIIFPTGWRTGTAASPPLQHGVAKIYEVLGVPCVPIAHDAVRCWPHGSWLRLPGCIRVHVLPPIPPGLDKATFLHRLHSELFGATDDLLSPPEPPAMYSRTDAAGRDLFRAIMDVRS